MNANADAPARTLVVVPCFNEEKRLDPSAFVDACRDDDVQFVFVDDGSTDGTGAALESMRAAHPEVGEILTLDRNRGKAEAVRRGVLHAATKNPDFVGYWDADLATPLDEIPRFIAVLDERPDVEIVMGSRVNLLGRHVHRKLLRHYIGRVFATLVAAGLRLGVYDTQCGAKMFRCTPDVMSLFAEPFYAKWIFDAELLVRAIDRHDTDGLERVRQSTYELPLQRWYDIEGSALRPMHALEAARDLVRIFGLHIIAGRHRRGTGGLTYRVSCAVRDLLRSISVDGSSITRLGRTWRTLVTIPTFGVFVLWSRLRAWLSGPVSYVAVARDGSRFVCRVPDLVQSYLFMFGVWEPDLTAFIRRRMEPERTFIDVGANIGYHSMVAASSAGGAARVVAIEASPDICDHLRLDVTLNAAADRITIVNKAASDHRGEIVIYRGPVHNRGLTTSVEGRGFDAFERVECGPLDALLDEDDIRTARLVKIDVEGAESAVLAGMADFLDRCPDDVEVLVELSPKWWADQSQTPEMILRPFFARGFHAYEIDNNLVPWRYLWPEVVRPPTRTRRDLTKKPRRIDLVLSRVDAESL